MDDIDDIWDDFDWELAEVPSDEKEIPIGSDIQRALRDKCLKVSPYVKMEVGTNTRFDLVMYLPEPMPFIANQPISYHCWYKFRRIYCKKIWGEVKNQYAIPEEERKERREKAIADGKDSWGIHIPYFRFEGKEYQYDDDFWKSDAKKKLAICDQPNCDWWKKRQEENAKEKEEYGFMNGLHIFEIKSDKDKHDLLIHQIPNMVAIADYVWLVLGENQPTPEWLPPYISVLRHKKGAFVIEYRNRIEITQPRMYVDALRSQGIKMENKEKYAFMELMRKWKINSMFHYTFEGQILIDMQKDIENLLSFLRRADKNKTKEDYTKFQRNLFEYIGHNGDEGSGTNGIGR